MIQAIAAVLAGFVVGMLSGAMGIGGGILLVPLMVLGFGFAQHLAQGTSLAAIIPPAVVGAWTHDRAGQVARGAAVWVGGGGVIGAILGALVADRMPREVLIRLFGALLLFSAYRIYAGRR